MAKHKIKKLRITPPRGCNFLREASGVVNGKPFAAQEYEDHHAMRGAEPHRWSVCAKRATRESQLTRGEKLAIAQKIHWIDNHCTRCRHSFHGDSCMGCKCDGGPCKRRCGTHDLALLKSVS